MTAERQSSNDPLSQNKLNRLEAKPVHPLTPNAKAVLFILASGFNLKAINSLGLTPEDYGKARMEVLSGLGASSTLEAVMIGAYNELFPVKEMLKGIDPKALDKLAPKKSSFVESIITGQRDPKSVREADILILTTDSGIGNFAHLLILAIAKKRGLYPEIKRDTESKEQTIFSKDNNKNVEAEILPLAKERQSIKRNKIIRGNYAEEEQEVLELIRSGLTDDGIWDALERSRLKAGKDPLSEDRSEIVYVTSLREKHPAVLHEARVEGARIRYYKSHAGVDLNVALNKLGQERRIVLDAWIKNPEQGTAAKMAKLLENEITSSSAKKIQNIFGEAYSAFEISSDEEHKKIQLEAVYVDALKLSVDKKTSSE